jgi:hypothetical protein
MKYNRTKLRELIQSLTPQEFEQSLDDFPSVRYEFTAGQEKSVRDGIILDYFEKNQEDKFFQFLKAISKYKPRAYDNYMLELLKIIFDNFDQEELLKKITPVYSNCFSKYQSDWQPQNLKDIFRHLHDVYRKESSLTKIVNFVIRLLRSQELSEIINNNLKEWCAINKDDFDKIENPDAEIQNRNEENYLIILIVPSFQFGKDRFIVKAWIVSNINYEEFNSSMIEEYQALDITSKKQETFLFEDIHSHLLKDFINQAISKLKNLNPLTIELFLPYDVLTKPIKIGKSEDEMIDDNDDDLPVPIGVNYKVHIRSYDRIKKFLSSRGEQSNEKIRFWQQKWRILQENYTESCVSCFISGSYNDNWQDIYSNLKSDQIIGLKLSHLPKKEILRAINDTGTPIALWLMLDGELPQELKNDHKYINEYNYIPLGVEIVLITNDAKTLLRRRGKNVATSRYEWDVSFSGYCGNTDLVGEEQELQMWVTVKNEFLEEIDNNIPGDTNNIYFTTLHRNNITRATDLLGYWKVEISSKELANLLSHKYPGTETSTSRRK